MKPNSFKLEKNKKKANPSEPGYNPKWPDYRGVLTVTEPGTYYIAGWLRTSEYGQFVSGELTRKDDEPATPPAPMSYAEAKGRATKGPDDDIPF